MYEDRAGEYRWRLRSKDNEIIATASEGYVNKSDAIHGINLVKVSNPATSVEDLTSV
ncbi:MAG: YegP family protein [Thermoplasmata archaeon]